MGFDFTGQLGDGSSGFGTNQPEEIIPANVTAVSAGYQHSLFIKSDGSLWAMGNNAYGQLGDGSTNTINHPEQIVPGNVTAIATEGDTSLFLKSDGSLWGMGRNSSSQLGDGTTNNALLPEEIVSGNVTAVASGLAHTLFVKTDGSLWAMGGNDSGELGDGTTDDVKLPELIAVVAGYNQIVLNQIDAAGVHLSFMGMAGANYALDRSLDLASSSWVPQMTNTADASGMVVFINVPVAGSNNFWRVRRVP